MTEPHMTHAQAKEALSVFVRQQMEAEALLLLEGLVAHVARHAHELDDPKCRVTIGAVPYDYSYAEILQHARALGLEMPEPFPWLAQVQELLAQIRLDLNIPLPTSTHQPHHPWCP